MQLTFPTAKAIITVLENPNFKNSLRIKNDQDLAAQYNNILYALEMFVGRLHRSCLQEKKEVFVHGSAEIMYPLRRLMRPANNTINISPPSDPDSLYLGCYDRWHLVANALFPTHTLLICSNDLSCKLTVQGLLDLDLPFIMRKPKPDNLPDPRKERPQVIS